MGEENKIPDDPVKDPKNFRMVIFYHNKEDNRLMPPKQRIGSGWEINFGHPRAGLLLLGIIFGSLLLALFCILVASWLM